MVIPITNTQHPDIINSLVASEYRLALLIPIKYSFPSYLISDSKF